MFFGAAISFTFICAPFLVSKCFSLTNTEVSDKYIPDFFENIMIGAMNFRAEKRNKYARVLAVCQAPSLQKNGGNFVDHVNRKGYELLSMFSQYSR